MKKKIASIIYSVILILLLLRIITISISLINYFQTKTICIGNVPSYPTEKDELFPNPIVSVEPFLVKTDKGIMIIGDEYEILGEGSWYGRMVLIWSGLRGSYFLVTFNEPNLQSISQRPTCRWFRSLIEY